MKISTIRGKINKINSKKILIRLAAILFWIAVWQVISMFINQEILIVSPVKVIKRIGELSGTAEFWQITALSFVRITLGFLLALIIGIVFGIITTKSKVLYALVQPMISLIKATPVTSFIMLAFVWISPTGYITVFISFLIVLPIIWANVIEGIKNTDKNLLQMASVMGAGRRKIFFKIYKPSVNSYLVAACSVAYGMSWKAGIAAEVITRPKLGIGSEMFYSKMYIETKDLFAWTLVAIVLSVVFERLFIYLLNLGKRKKGGEV